MKKTLKLLIIILMTIVLIFSVKCSSYAEDTQLTVSMGISAPNEGIYGVGQEIDIKITFSKPIKGQLPNYTIKIGNSSNEVELTIGELTQYTTEAIYKYTIKSGDNGKIKPGSFINPANYTIEDESGNQYSPITPGGIAFNKEIYASTTINWTDFSNAQIKMTSESKDSNSDFYFKVENVTPTSENNQYYVHFSHSSEDNIILKNSKDVYNNVGSQGEQIWQTTYRTKTNKISADERIRNFVAEKGDIYITICEIDDATSIPNIVLKSKKIERIESLPLSKRFSAYFFNDKTSTFCWEPHGEIERKVNYKIGRITDINLLKSLKNEDASALSSLMEYAKNQTPLYTGTIKLGEDATITDKLDLIDDEYYYVYLQLDSENGKYLEIEDVNLYQALVSERVGKNLFDMGDAQFHWNLDENSNQNTDQSTSEPVDDTTIKKGNLPYAGKVSIITLFVIALSGITLVLYKKYKQYKGI